MRRLIKLLLLLILINSGCAVNQVTVTYYSDPPGAAVYEGQKAFGFTPVKVFVSIPPEMQKSRIIRINETKAVWASGAYSTVPYIELDLQQNSNFYFTFIRPNVPGREADLNFALQLERNRILQQQAQAQTDQAAMQAYGVLLNSFNRPTYSPNYNKSLNCTSNINGNYIYTDCW